MKLWILLAIAAIGCTIGFGATPAQAQATRTWVSGVGDDVNPCSRTAPCKTFAGAISKTAAGGEIDCLDPGGFGAVTITKSITIDCDGTFGSILAAGFTGVIVNDSATGAPNSIRVVLRGLSINGAGTGTIGINFISGASLVLEEVVVQNFNAGTAVGVNFRPQGSAQLFMTNSIVTGNGTGGTGGGVLIQPTGASGQALATLNNVAVDRNSGFGVSLNSTGNNGPSTLTSISNSRLVRNDIGLSVLSPPATTGLTVALDGSTIFANTTGIRSDGGSIQIGVSNTTLQGNVTALVSANGGTIQSFGDNRLIGNGVASAFNPPALTKQ